MRGRQLSKGTEPNPTRARARTEIRQISEKRSERGDTDAKAKPPLAGPTWSGAEGAARHASDATQREGGREHVAAARRGPRWARKTTHHDPCVPSWGRGRARPGRRRHRPRTQQAERHVGPRRPPPPSCRRGASILIPLPRTAHASLSSLHQRRAAPLTDRQLERTARGEGGRNLSRSRGSLEPEDTTLADKTGSRLEGRSSWFFSFPATWWGNGAC